MWVKRRVEVKHFGFERGFTVLVERRLQRDRLRFDTYTIKARLLVEIVLVPVPLGQKLAQEHPLSFSISVEDPPFVWSATSVKFSSLPPFTARSSGVRLRDEAAFRCTCAKVSFR